MSHHNKHRGSYEIAPGLTMDKLYSIINTKLENVVVTFDTFNGSKRGLLSEHTDIDVITQRIVWFEVERALGIFPNVGSEPPHSVDDDDLHMMFANYTMVQEHYFGAYSAVAPNQNLHVIIVPARNAHEAKVGSGILAIGASRFEAWANAVKEIIS